MAKWLSVRLRTNLVRISLLSLEHIVALSKNVYTDKLLELVKQCNSTISRIVLFKMYFIDAKLNTCIDSGVEFDIKTLNLRLIVM